MSNNTTLQPSNPNIRSRSVILCGRIQHLLVKSHRPEMPKFARLVSKPWIELRRIHLSDCFHFAAPVSFSINACHPGNDSGKKQIQIIFIYIRHKAILLDSTISMLPW